MIAHLSTVLTAATLALGVLCAAAPAQAERADRSKPMTVEADKPGTVDLQRQVVQFNGNVVIAQGTMQIRAESIEVRERSDGFRAATATGSAAKPASFRQKRDGVDEVVEGSAERIEYDGKSDTLRFVGQASVRRLRGGLVADEINGALITWDNTSELFSVKGGAPSPDNPTGRVRAVFSPPEVSTEAAPPAAGAVPLKPSRSLGVPR
jgi:lipopolysaccharide export system protein LptA